MALPKISIKTAKGINTLAEGRVCHEAVVFQGI